MVEVMEESKLVSVNPENLVSQFPVFREVKLLPREPVPFPGTNNYPYYDPLSPLSPDEFQILQPQRQQLFQHEHQEEENIFVGYLPVVNDLNFASTSSGGGGGGGNLEAEAGMTPTKLVIPHPVSKPFIHHSSVQQSSEVMLQFEEERFYHGHQLQHHDQHNRRYPTTRFSAAAAAAAAASAASARFQDQRYYFIPRQVVYHQHPQQQQQQYQQQQQQQQYQKKIMPTPIQIPSSNTALGLTQLKALYHEQQRQQQQLQQQQHRYRRGRPRKAPTTTTPSITTMSTSSTSETFVAAAAAAAAVNPTMLHWLQRHRQAQQHRQHPKKPRTIFSDAQAADMLAVFKQTPYISAVKRAKMAEHLEISEETIAVWFKNQRSKLKKKMAVYNYLGKQKQ